MLAAGSSRWAVSSDEVVMGPLAKCMHRGKKKQEDKEVWSQRNEAEKCKRTGVKIVKIVKISAPHTDIPARQHTVAAPCPCLSLSFFSSFNPETDSTTWARFQPLHARRVPQDRRTESPSSLVRQHCRSRVSENTWHFERTSRFVRSTPALGPLPEPSRTRSHWHLCQWKDIDFRMPHSLGNCSRSPLALQLQDAHPVGSWSSGDTLAFAATRRVPALTRRPHLQVGSLPPVVAHALAVHSSNAGRAPSQAGDALVLAATRRVPRTRPRDA
ncbi:hypothetical protein EV363DRAFT_1525712 [Boletus edulis]|nr:hypothetical protein EV363DRAFT_1299250 [Boletus edulis]KAF8126596.1 hypothetical protein EV363DRAFT_1525712 [Boletus edulis]